MAVTKITFSKTNNANKTNVKKLIIYYIIIKKWTKKIDRDDNIGIRLLLSGKVAAAEKLRDGRMKAVEKRGGQMSNEAIAAKPR